MFLPVFYMGIFFVNASHQAEPGRNSRSGLSFLFCLFTRVCVVSFLSTFPSGEPPRPSRAPHFVGAFCFALAFVWYLFYQRFPHLR